MRFIAVRSFAVLALLSAAAFGQIKAVVTVDSIAVVKAGSLAATVLQRNMFSAVNIGTTPLNVSAAGIAIDFPEIAQVNSGDVTDIFSTKAAMSKPARAVQILKYIGIGMTFVTGSGILAASSKIVGDIGLATIGLGEFENQLTAQIPATANDISGQIPSTGVTIAPGGSYQCKIYTSRPPKGMGNNAIAYGPRIMSTAIVPAATPSAAAMASPGVSTQQYVLTPLVQGMPVQSGSNTIMVMPTQPSPAPKIQDYIPPPPAVPTPQVQPSQKPEDDTALHSPWTNTAELCGV